MQKDSSPFSRTIIFLAGLPETLLDDHFFNQDDKIFNRTANNSAGQVMKDISN
jgi:hypothetical protein